MPCLLNPMLALDAVSEGEADGELADVVVVPGGDLGVSVDAEDVKTFFEDFGDAFERGKIIARIRTRFIHQAELGIDF